MRNLHYTFTLTFLFLFGTAFSVQAQSGVELGMASYYADAFQGRKTASGELYDKNKYSAAHKDLPFGTLVRVTRLDNKMSVKVRINDRGPYIAGRIIELSRVAAQKVDLIDDGDANVKVEILEKGSLDDMANIEKPISKPAPPKVEKKSVPASYSTTPKKKVVKAPAKPKPAPAKSVARTAPAPKPVLSTKGDDSAVSIESPEEMKFLTLKNFKTYDLYKIDIKQPEHVGFGVQVASLTSYDNVIKTIAELQGKWFENILISVEKGDEASPVYKAILGPFADRDAAEAYKKQLKKNKKMSGFVVDLSGL